MRSPLHGPPPALPRPLDRLAERWARTAPRLRIALVVMLLMLFGAFQANRLAASQSQWGGQGERVWRATRTVGAGQPVGGAVRPVRLPRAAIPDTALTGALDRDAILAVPLVEGGILTRIHVDPIGPAVALPADMRAVPIPVEASWGVEPGILVDVWSVTTGDDAPQRLAQGRSVLSLNAEGPRPVALVAMHEDDVGAATAALARGRVLLTLRGAEP